MSDKPMTPIQFEDSLDDIIPDDEIAGDRVMLVINGLHTQARIKYEECYSAYQQLQQENERLRKELYQVHNWLEAYESGNRDEKIAGQRREIDRQAEQTADLTAKLEAAEREVLQWRRIRTPTHGTCCTCQGCGQSYDDCRCDLDLQADRIRTLESLLSRCVPWLERAGFEPIHDDSGCGDWSCTECGAFVMHLPGPEDHRPDCPIRALLAEITEVK